METRRPTYLYLLSLCMLSSFSLTLSFHKKFSPIDNYLINCGSAVDSSVFNRRFFSDHDFFNSESPLVLSRRTIPVANQNPLPNSPQIYQTVRVFEKPSKYVFQIKDRGTHMVRLHFNPFVSSNWDLNEARFHVLVDGYVVLSNFSALNAANPVIKEYMLWVDSDKLVVTFVPVERGNFGFVNAIEVISAPKDLIADVATVVNGDKIEKIAGLTKQALENVYRINVGGYKLTPFNDTLWRTWIPDDEFFKSSDYSKKVYFSGYIMYGAGLASREVAPDFVYGTARTILTKNASIPQVNMTWKFPVDGGYRYLVRMHFCDIASIALGLLNFNVYVNGYLAYENLDLSSITYMLAAPFYADFVVDGGSSDVLTVSIGPSNMSLGYAVDGILNGLEIMKMNNSMGSLDGTVCAGMIWKNWPRKSIGVLVPLIAVICLVLSVSMIFRRRKATRNSVPWAKLPTDETDTKNGNQGNNYHSEQGVSA
ncbi:hypothetical protein K2173_013411 [Erythroxylum novogranatense]|uniref:Malectin-like domain-containing protein n=1 Tax=Erythroxylum novogranatense TaxID=1862640 RepID=A0AAV8S9T0_9ROSI|nr:hypothetical protein K2173_013411 [Erythroxylum novogranatense]